MTARLTQDWRVAPEGHTVVMLPAGSVLTGDLAERAVRAGVAEFDPREPPKTVQLETKRRRRKARE